MKKKWVIRFLWLLVFAIAAMIFYFSSQEGEDSLKTSSGIAVFLMRLIHPDFDGMTGEEKRAIFERFQYLVRKGAHFTEFAMLGASLRLLFHALLLRKPVLWAWVVGTLYACTDEMHQMLTDARSPRVQDVCIDSAGVLTAALFVTLWLYVRKKRKQIKNP